MLSQSGQAMRSVEDAVSVGTSTTALPNTIATDSPTVVAATGAVGLLRLVPQGAADPHSLVPPEPAGSNPGRGSVSSNNKSGGPANMDQAEEFVKPIFKDGEILLEVECGQNKAAMYLSKLCQGSKGPCISFQGSWLTPNEFQFVSGRETAKDWKRSIRHHGKSLKLLLAKGILSVHPTMCDCDGCRIGAVLTRKGEKRRIPNGERKRKSAGSAAVPENTGQSAVRAVSSVGKGQCDKKIPQEKNMDSKQSPLKESSVLNVPEVKDTGSHKTQPAMLHVDCRRTSPVTSANSDSWSEAPGSASPLQTQCVNTSSCRPTPSDTGLVIGRSDNSLRGVAPHPTSSLADVKVLSSSRGSCATLDKSLSRLALYQAASARVKGESEGSVKFTGVNVPAVARDASCSINSGTVRENNSTVSGSSHFQENYVGKSGSDMPVSTSSGPNWKGDNKTDKLAHSTAGSHSTLLHRAHEAARSDTTSSAAVPRDPDRDDRQSHFALSTGVSVAEKGQVSMKNGTSQCHSDDSAKNVPSKARDVSSDRHQEANRVFLKHSSSPHTHHHDERRRWDSERDSKREHNSKLCEHDCERDTGLCERDCKLRERESDEHRQEERTDDKQKTLESNGCSKSTFSEDKRYSSIGQELSRVGAQPDSLAGADPGAFSDYMRVLAAGHHALLPPSASCLPPLFPLRPPTDVSVSSGYLHPMHAATVGLLPKDPVLFPAVMPTAMYHTPRLTPLQLLGHQYTASATTPVLDYPQSYQYPAWTAYHLAVPDAMSTAAASSISKRPREEGDSAVDLSPKRLCLDPPLGMSLYGSGVDYLPGAYRGLATPLSCGLESSLYDKSADFLRKRLYPDVTGIATHKGPESPYLASLPDYYRALYCCSCMDNRPEDVRTWSVEGVAKFVASLDGCGVYADIFREQRVDGRILVLLTVEHLMRSLGMKLGPAVMLTQHVAKLLHDATRASGCDMCKRLASMVPAMHTSVGY